MSLGLRPRVTLLAAGMTALSLTGGTFLLFWVLETQLTGGLDDDMTNQARVTADAVSAWGQETLVRSGKRVSSTQIQTWLSDTDATKDLADLFSPPKDLPNSVVSMLLAADGTIVRQSHAPNAVSLVPEDVFAKVRAGAVHSDTATLTDSQDRDRAYRVATAPVFIGGHVEAFVQIWRPLTVLTITLSLRSALRPVDALIGQIRGISQSNLDVRVAVPASRDEVRRLAETFNGMLDRLEGTLETTLDTGRS